MTVGRSGLAHRLSHLSSVPRLAKIGAALSIIGVEADLILHLFVDHADPASASGLPMGGHLGHLVVLIGMVLVLAGVIVDGMRTAARVNRQKGDPRDAIR